MIDLLKSCDTLEAIQESIKSIKSFNELLELRNQVRKEQGDDVLHNWIVCGHISLDNFAQTFQFSYSKEEYMEKSDYIHNLPSVFLMAERGKYGIKSSSSGFSGSHGNPEWYSICPITKRGWNVDNYFKNMKEIEEFTFNLKDYIGKNITEVYEFFHAKSVQEGITYKVWKQMGIYNDKYIDLTPLEDYPKLVKNISGHWSPKQNKYGRDVKDEFDIIGDKYIVEEGDKVEVKKITLYHINGYMLKQATDNLLEFEKCFIKAGFKQFDFTFTKNEYWRNDLYTGTWYNVSTEFGNIRVGWRKRVVEIVVDNDKVDCNAVKQELEHDVTSEKNLIHAWKIEDVSLYLQKIREQLIK